MDQHKLATPKGDITHDWSVIWATPAWIAVVVVDVFVVFFREPKKTSTSS